MKRHTACLCKCVIRRLAGRHAGFDEPYEFDAIWFRERREGCRRRKGLVDCDCGSCFSVNRQYATASAGITHITRWQDPEEKMQKQLSYIEKDKCHFVDTRLPKLHQMRD